MTTPIQPGHGTATITEWNLAAGGGQGASVKPGVKLTVDFDPRSLELRYSAGHRNVEQETQSSGRPRNNAPSQWTSDATTLSMQLIFDSTPTGTSVQLKTDQLVKLIRQPPPAADPHKTTPAKVVLFHWGSFNFFGSVSSMSQTIEYFSAAGVPLRATVDLVLKAVAPPASVARASSGAAPPASFGAGVGVAGGASVSAGAAASASVGTTPLTLSAAGDTVQSISAQAGTSVSWKVVAAANNIDNPRVLPPGTVLDLSAGATANVSAGATASAGVTASGGANASAGATTSAGLQIS